MFTQGSREDTALRPPAGDRGLQEICALAEMLAGARWALKMEVMCGLSTYYVPGTILHSGVTEAGQTGKVSALQGFPLQPKETVNPLVR